MRLILLASLLAIGGFLISVGVGMYSTPAGFIVGGVLLCGLGWLLFGEVDEVAE